MDEFEAYIMSPDTIPLIMNGALAGGRFMPEHKIRPGTALQGGYFINYADRGEADDLIRDAGEKALSMIPIILGHMDVRHLDAAGIIPARLNPYLDLRGRGVLIGFVDTGIDYTKDAFIYEDNTSKIKYIWDQTIPGGAPAGFHFGTEYSQEAIDLALASENPRELVPHRDLDGHGTFLASVAAGREQGEYSGAAPDSEIIAVKLRRAQPFFYERFLIPERQKNAYTSADLLLGVQYILSKAEELKRPAAICIAVGSSMGGHDGLSIAEEYLTRISNLAGFAVACAAGNESQSGRHATGRLISSGDEQSVELAAGARSEDIYISMYNGASDRLSVSVKSPSGESVPKIAVRSGTSYSANLVLESSRVTVEYYLPMRGSGDQLTVIKLLHPTPGLWTITVHGEIILDGTYHLWMPITGFTDPDTVFLRPSPNYTVVTPATAAGVTACGAYDSRSGALYPASSWGPTRRPSSSPDLAAPGVNIPGVFPTGYGAMSGTCASAAVTAGACALMLQWGIVLGNDMTLSSNRIRANLIRGCVRDLTGEYPNAQWGYGKLNLYNTLSIIRPV